MGGWWVVGWWWVLDFARLRLSQLSLVNLKLGLSLATEKKKENNGQNNSPEMVLPVKWCTIYKDVSYANFNLILNIKLH